MKKQLSLLFLIGTLEFINSNSAIACQTFGSDGKSLPLKTQVLKHSSIAPVFISASSVATLVICKGHPMPIVEGVFTIVPE